MEANKANDQQGEGFAFFRWHATEYRGHCPGHPHGANQQGICRMQFRRFNQNIPALQENVSGN